MKHFRLTKTQLRISRITNIALQLQQLQHNDPLKIEAAIRRLKSALGFLSSRHNKRANDQLLCALAIIKSL